MYRAHKASTQSMDDFTKTGSVTNADRMNGMFAKFAKGKGHLDLADFNELLNQLFTDSSKPGQLDSDLVKQFFHDSDTDGDGIISKTEFEQSWKSWISNVVNPVCALVVVDVQNDFITGTLSLTHCPAKHNGAEVVPVINTLLDKVNFHLVVYTRDWHPPDHISFFENVKDRPFHRSSKISRDDAKLFDEVIFDIASEPRTQILWPAHCIQNSTGADLHQDLNVVDGHYMVKKGCSPDVDSYSAFWDNGKLSQTNLHDEFKSRGITDVYVCGLAYDVCVAYTARHACEYGYRTVFIEDACRGVSESGMNETKRELTNKHVLFIQSNQVSDLVSAKVRPTELAKVSLEK